MRCQIPEYVIMDVHPDVHVLSHLTTSNLKIRKIYLKSSASLERKQLDVGLLLGINNKAFFEPGFFCKLL